MSALILVVDDDPQVVKTISHRLEQEGFAVAAASDGEEALRKFADHKPALIVLDLVLPEQDGLEVLRRIREESDVPVVILSAKAHEIDRLLGFRMGVDDYVAKPFNPSELAVRIRAILRRILLRNGDRNSRGALVTWGPLAIDRSRRSVKIGGRPVQLTAKEFDLLWLLTSHPEQVFTREQLLYQLWGTEGSGDPNNVTVVMSRLRGKLGRSCGAVELVKTVWGVGYKFSPVLAPPAPGPSGARGRRPSHPEEYEFHSECETK
ncbi:MAG: response regulator transcription factor [Firmicutes bacterium]|nr:response regulator transcription factor [Bacillota bacterium]